MPFMSGFYNPRFSVEPNSKKILLNILKRNEVSRKHTSCVLNVAHGQMVSLNE